MHFHRIPEDDAADFEPLNAVLGRVSAGIASSIADQARPGSGYLKNPPLTTREREWADRARLALRLIEVLAGADPEEDLPGALLRTPSLDPAIAALRAIVTDAERAVSPRV